MLAEFGSNVAIDVIAGVLLTGLGGGMLWARKQMKGLGQLVKDWNGEAPRPGISNGKPSVMARLYTQESQFREVMDHLGRQDSTLELIKSEVEYNHGGSIKDAVHRTDNAVKGLKIDVDHIQKTLEAKS